MMQVLVAAVRPRALARPRLMALVEEAAVVGRTSLEAQVARRSYGLSTKYV